jgi:ribosomal protein L37AE/L43A
MAERTLRGARLGGQSFEDERGIEFAARQQVGYRCPQAHEFEITMSVEADIPAVWECPRCGAEALSVSGIVP